MQSELLGRDSHPITEITYNAIFNQSMISKNSVPFSARFLSVPDRGTADDCGLPFPEGAVDAKGEEGRRRPSDRSSLINDRRIDLRLKLESTGVA